MFVLLEDGGGSWVLISRVISRVSMVITLLSVLQLPLFGTHEPPNKVRPCLGFESESPGQATAKVKATAVNLLKTIRNLVAYDFLSDLGFSRSSDQQGLKA